MIRKISLNYLINLKIKKGNYNEMNDNDILEYILINKNIGGIV